MSKFKKIGRRYFPFGASGEVVSRLEPAIYAINFNPMAGVFLDEECVTYPVPGRIYGDTEAYADRVIKTYMRRRAMGKNTGILLSGTKGDGKSLLAKIISNKIVALEGSVISVTSDIEPTHIETAFKDIHGPSVCLIDELEKRYHDKRIQQQMLTFVDGGSATGILFIFTVNDIYAVDEHFINRPGRIYYMREYNGIGDDFIREYCDHNLDNKNNAESIIAVSKLFDSFSFDSLIALVEEMNFYNEDAREAIKYLAIRPTFASNVGNTYSMEIFYGRENITNIFDPIERNINPYNKRENCFYVHIKDEHREHPFVLEQKSFIDMEDHSIYVNLSHNTEITSSNPLTFRIKGLEDTSFVFKKEKPKSFYSHLLTDSKKESF